jgi:hypothetical protein
MRIEGPGNAAHREEADRKLEELGRRHRLGDLSAKKYERLRHEVLVGLARGLIAPQLEPGEKILLEHHWYEGHETAPVSVLRESAQVAESLFATDRRLFRWRCADKPTPDACTDPAFRETLEAKRFEALSGLERRLRVRWGEALAGTLMTAAAAVFWSHLQVTAPFMLGLGVLAFLHGLLWPTRTVTVTSRAYGEPGWSIGTPRRKSGRELVAFLERKLAPGG